MNPVSLEQLLTHDPLAPVQAAIVGTVKSLLTGVSVQAHPGKVDLSELVAKTVVAAPGIGIGWSRVKASSQPDGHFTLSVEWVAYIVTEAKVIDSRRVEKEVVGMAIGSCLLAILADRAAPFWGLTGLYAPEAAELKPLLTIRDAAQGTAYYTVSWRQDIVDRGISHFPDYAGTADPDNGTINYDNPEWIEAIAPFLPGREVDDA